LSDFLPYADKINLVIFNARQKIYPVTSGFSKWKPADEQIELLSPTRALKYSGLLDKGQNRYQTTVDGFFTLNFDEPFLLIAETLN
jgi:thiamine pyrophosphokinase